MIVFMEVVMKEKKNTLIAFRVTEKEKAELAKIAKKSKRNITDIFRDYAQTLVQKVSSAKT